MSSFRIPTGVMDLHSRKRDSEEDSWGVRGQTVSSSCLYIIKNNERHLGMYKL